MEGLIPYQNYLLSKIFMLGLVIVSYPGKAQQLVFTSNPVTRVLSGKVFRYTFSAIDSMGKAISYSVDNLPSWIQYEKNTQTISGTTDKAGQYLVTIRAVTEDTVVGQNFMLTVYNKRTINILPLGNSITNGTGSYNSYRRSLWQLLHKANFNFDMIGSWALHHGGGPVPEPDFDMDHEGHSGWTAHDVLQPPGWDEHRGNIDKWLLLYRPDIVLMELGTNEVFQCLGAEKILDDMSLIIEKIRQKNKTVKILIAQIPPLGEQWAAKKLCGTDTSYAEAIKIFNTSIVKFAQNNSTSRSSVIVVDQFTGVDPSKDMYDDIHPNTNGEKKMAERWFKALAPLLRRRG